MLAHKLVIDDTDIPFKLIAIHCSSEEYKVAFLLNRHLNIKLARARTDHDFISKAERAVFALYKYEHQQQYCNYYLISNRFKVYSNARRKGTSLFEGEAMDSTPIHLLPQYPKVDYLLKVEEEFDTVSPKILLDNIKKIPQVATAYVIDTENLKFKDNLIFD